VQAGEIGIEYEEGPRAKGAGGGGARAAGRAGGESVAILGDLSRAHAKCSNEKEKENALKMYRGMKLKGQWTADEDALLTELVNKYGTTRWSYIARARCTVASGSSVGNGGIIISPRTSNAGRGASKKKRRSFKRTWSSGISGHI
jgi:hypothetical protein